jgi:hypothetical protein
LQISKSNGSAIKFGYDASGNRILKEQGSRTTYYVRDASGNVMATYVKEPVAGSTTPELRLTEQPIYSSSRVARLLCLLPHAPLLFTAAAGFASSGFHTQRYAIAPPAFACLPALRFD